MTRLASTNRPRRAAVCAFASAVAFGPSFARAADTNHAQLRYEVDAPPGTCPTEAEFRARVASRLGYDPFRDDAALSLRVRITARGAQPRAQIVLVEGGKQRGTRTLEDPRCEALGETAASSVALALDPVAASSRSETPSVAKEPERTPAPMPTPPPAAAPTESTPPVPDRGADRPSSPPPANAIASVLYADATVAFGRAASALAGARGGFALRGTSLSVAIEGHFETMPSAAALAPADRVNVSVYSGAIVPCGHWGAFALCGVGTFGARQAKALDVTMPTTKTSFASVVGVRPGIEWPLGKSVALRAHAEVGVALVRTTYTIEPNVEWSPSPVEGTLALGISGRL